MWTGETGCWSMDFLMVFNRFTTLQPHFRYTLSYNPSGVRYWGGWERYLGPQHEEDQEGGHAVSRAFIVFVLLISTCWSHNVSGPHSTRLGGASRLHQTKWCQGLFNNIQQNGTNVFCSVLQCTGLSWRYSVTLIQPFWPVTSNV